MIELMILLAVTMLLGAIGVGGGLYETILIDPVWPSNPRIIQPAQGGIRRARFWIPAHAFYELALIVSLIFSWSLGDVRYWLLAALTLQIVMRAWSFAVFIPKALAFEECAPEEVAIADAKAWTRWSRLRIPLSLLSVLATSAALIRLGAVSVGP